jgi:hypothetical protein
MTKKEFREIELLAMEGLKETAKTDPAKVPEILKSLKEAARKVGLPDLSRQTWRLLSP